MEAKKPGGIKRWYAKHSDDIKKVASVMIRATIFGAITYTAGNIKGTSDTINSLLDANQDNPEVINAIQKCATDWFNVK